MKSIIYKLCVIIIVAIIYSNSFAQNFNFTPEAKLAYQEIFKFKFNNAKTIINQQKKEDDSNLMPYFLEDYIDFFSLYISEDKSLYNSIKIKSEQRIKLLASGNSKSPYYLYTQAEVHLHIALCKLKFQDYISAVFEVKKAYNLLQENQEKFPTFKPNLKSLGLLHTIFGAVPDNYKFGAKLLGLKGSIEQGLTELKTVINDKNFEFRQETIILYCFLQLHLNKNETEAWNILAFQDLSTSDNLLNTFIKANIAQHLGKNEEVITIIKNKPTSLEFYPIYFLDFMLGNALLQKLDVSAISHLKKYSTNFKGNSYKKECYRKMAWYAILHQQPQQYQQYMQLCESVAIAITDEDKSAQKEAERNIVPNKHLLTARILFDGNYLTQALEKIKQVDISNLHSREKIEYYYRKARIYDKLNKQLEANENYILTINKSNNTNYYFAANACIKLGNYFEQQKKYTLAKQYYNKAIQLPKDEYENSINAEAKAGLNRIK